jgi:hypothetical protein
MTSSRQLPPLASKLVTSTGRQGLVHRDPHRLPATARADVKRWNRAWCLGKIQPYKLADVLQGFSN